VPPERLQWNGILVGTTSLTYCTWKNKTRNLWRWNQNVLTCLDKVLFPFLKSYCRWEAANTA